MNSSTEPSHLTIFVSPSREDAGLPKTCTCFSRQQEITGPSSIPVRVGFGEGQPVPK
jgi:hypothetical protein